MNDLVDFLLARIAEDKAKARAAKTPVEILDDIGLIYESSGHWLVGWNGDYWADDAVEALKGAVTDAARVLADCEAKRQIVEAMIEWGLEFLITRMVVKRLALPYADHPDYRDEWRP